MNDEYGQADFKKTLVLDSSYIPRSVVTSTRAFVVVYKGSAEIIAEHPVEFKMVDENLHIKKPSIIRIPRYVKVGHHKVNLNKQNVFKRDNYSCVYCGSREKRKLTIDHVIPQSAGGGNSWSNLVTACFDCNNRKGSMSLEEFGATIDNPRKPHYLMLMQKQQFIYEEWKPYLLY